MKTTDYNQDEKVLD